MKYIAIFGYDENTDVAMACVLSEKPSMEPIAYWKKPIQEIISLVIANQFKPLNFGIDRNKNLQQDNGSFSRFIKEGSLVILAEFINEKKETVGYRVLSTTNGNPFNMTLADIKQLYLKRKATFKQDNIIFIQNAIVRQYENDITIACYPLKSFEQIEIKAQKIPATVKKVPVTKVEKEPTNTKSVKNDGNSASQPVSYSSKQEKELALCEELGIDKSIISDPRLSREQMRVLWLSKLKRNALSEYFNNPAMSLDVMKFYANTLTDAAKLENYKPLLAHPELGLSEVRELSKCADLGLSYEDLIGLSADDIYFKRLERDPNFWTTADFSVVQSDAWKDGELFDLMMQEAEHIHSGIV